MSVKILIAGDVLGKFDELFKRVDAVNKKAGPFDALFCVGQFFAPGSSDGDVPESLAEYVNGTKLSSVPLHFVGAFGAGSSSTLAALASGGQSSISHLGLGGVTEIKGLTVAYLDDGRCKAEPDAADVQPDGLKGAIARLKKGLSAVSVDVDLLLTCAWPSNVLHGVPAIDGVDAALDSDAIADLAQTARPRYHVTGTKGPFVARAPYLNPDLGAGCHVTRFVSCGAVGNAGKAKWLHALGLKPAAAMSLEELQAQPADATPSPYIAVRKRGGEQAGLGEQTWRWQDSKKARHVAPSTGRPGVVINTALSVYVKNLPYAATEDELVDFFTRAGKVVDVRRTANSEGKLHGWAHIQFEDAKAVEAACSMSGQTLMGRELTIDLATGGEAKLNLGKPIKDCWFCLSNEQADVQLVVDVLEEVYLAIDKGPINDMHVLVVPVEHYPNMITLKPAAYAELEEMTSALKSAYASRGLEMVGFERYLGLHARGGNHAHINFIGVSREAAKRAQSAFERTAAKYDFAFQHVPAGGGEAVRQSVAQLVGGLQYFQVFLPDGSRLVNVISRDHKHPMHFGREVLALLAGVPDRSDWRQCKAKDGAEEELRSEEFRRFFQAFSPNLSRAQ